jgi:hypothetical protein
MYPFIIPMLIGAAGGLLTNRKDPLKAALMGAGLGAAGGALAPGLLGASNAAELAAVGTEGAGATAATGLEGMGYSAPAITGSEQVAAPVIDYSTQAGLGDTLNYHSGGLLDKAMGYGNQASQYMKPAVTAINAASAAQNMFGNTQPPQITQPPQMKTVPMNLMGLLQQSENLQKYDIEEQARKRAQMQQYINAIGGR